MAELTEAIIKTSMDMPPEDAIEFLKSKNVAIGWSTADQIKINNARMFTVAKTAKIDILQDIRDELVKALEKGTTVQEFQKTIVAKMQSKGWIGKEKDGKFLAPHRIRNIYRNNIQSSLQAGKWHRFIDNKKSRPYFEYDAVRDQSTTTICKTLDGLVLHADNPRWRTIYPPNHYGCRSTVNALTPQQAALRKNPITSAQKAFEPADGWDTNSGLEGWKPDKDRWDADLYGLGKFSTKIIKPPIKPFTLSTTVPQAEKQALSLGVKANYRNNLPIANQLNQSLHFMRKNKIKLPPEIEVKRLRGKFVGGQFDEATPNKIIINEKNPIFTQPNVKEVQRIMDFEKNSNVLSTNSAHHVVIHETGHLEHYKKNPNLYLKHSWSKLNKQEKRIALDVSKYAKTNPSEFIAETYTGLKLNFKYPKSVMDLYKSFGGPEL